ncbi:hypothetical protein [Escherichia coli]
MLKILRRANTYTETWAMPVAAPVGAAAKATLTVLGQQQRPERWHC